LGPTLREATITRATFTFRAGESVEVASERPMGFMVRRDAFDAALCRSAEAAGAHLMDGTPVRSVGLSAEGVRVITDAGSLVGRLVVGADGAAGAVARTLFPRRRRPTLVAVETLAPLPSGGGPSTGDHVLVDFGACPGGYAWAFPKRDHLNLGAMVRREDGAGLRAALRRFAGREPRLRGLASGPVVGALIPAYDGHLAPAAAGPAFLVGDAAGLVDPFLGEGIYYAVRSGQLLAAALAEGDEDLEAAGARYRQRLAEEVEPDLRAALTLARLIHRFPRLWFRVLSASDRLLEAYCRILRGESTYRELLERIQDRAAHYLGERLAERLVSAAL
jgi:flavin-dependent dehydrogenase